MVRLVQDFVPAHIAKKVTAGGINGRKYITVHQTGNTSRGANARMHARLQKNGNSRTASWHYQVDDKEVIQSFPHTAQCYQSGDGRGHGNMDSISFELCVNIDGDYIQTLKNAAAAIRKVMKEENISIVHVVQHNRWSGKNCPAQIRAGKDGITWSKFIDMIKGVHVDVKPAQSANASTPAKLIKEENAYFLVTTPGGIKVRNKPSVSAEHTGTLKKGGSINYFKVYEGGGYRWLEYTGNSGNMLYVPYRESGSGKEQWGTFHSDRPGKSSAPTPAKKSNAVIAQEVIDGKWGNNPQRKQKLEAAGYNYAAIRAEVNRLAGAKPKKTIDQMALEIVAGKHGQGHANRQKSLGISAAEYQKVRARVNQLS